MIGKRIRERRKSLGLTQAEIHKATGISSGNLSEIENGKILPSSTALIHLSEVLKCSTDWILKGSAYENERMEDIYLKDSSILYEFMKLPADDQDEVMGLIKLKLNRLNRDLNTVGQNNVESGHKRNPDIL